MEMETFLVYWSVNSYELSLFYWNYPTNTITLTIRIVQVLLLSLRYLFGVFLLFFTSLTSKITHKVKYSLELWPEINILA